MDGLGYLVLIAAALVLVYLLVVYVILPLIGLALAAGLIMCAGLALAGMLSGSVVALRNFFSVLREAHVKVK